MLVGGPGCNEHGVYVAVHTACLPFVHCPRKYLFHETEPRRSCTCRDGGHVSAHIAWGLRPRSTPRSGVFVHVGRCYRRAVALTTPTQVCAAGHQVVSPATVVVNNGNGGWRDAQNGRRMFGVQLLQLFPNIVNHLMQL